MHRVVFWISLAFLLTIFAGTAFASDGTATSTASAEALEAPAEIKRFSLLLALESGSDLRTSGDAEASKGMDLLINPSLKASKNISISLMSIVSRPLTGEEREDILISNSRLSLTYAAPELIGKIKPSLTGSAILPTNKDSREQDLLRGGAGLDLQLARSFGALSAAYRIGGDRNVHEYTLDRDGSPNVQSVLRNRLQLSYKIGPVAISAEGNYQTAWTYRGFIREKFSVAEDIGYDISEKTSVWIGHTNEGAAYKANGRDTNIAFFDQNASQIRTGLSHSF